VSSFHHSKSNIELFFRHLQPVGNHHQNVSVDTGCCFQAKDSWILLRLGTWWSCQASFRDESSMQLIHVLFRFEFLQHPDLVSIVMYLWIIGGNVRWSKNTILS
jgi:hypothetical protein